MATNGEFCGERQEHSIQKCDAGSKVARPQSNFLDIGTTPHLPRNHSSNPTRIHSNHPPAEPGALKFMSRSKRQESR